MKIEVFLADDHTVVCDGLRFLLESQADIAVVGSASDGKSAVAQVRSLKPQVALIDVAMPEINGIEATQRIHASTDTKVIILSMYSTAEHVYRALQVGAQGYLLKESAGLEVVEAIRTVFRGRRYLSQRITDTVIDDYLTQRDTLPASSPLGCLSEREREVLQLVVEGKSSADIAAVLSLSPKTVETYRSRLMTKLDIKDLPTLVKFAIQHGLTPLN